MSKVTIHDAAQLLGVSKEAIHNRIRRGSLQSVVEDGVKLVIIEKEESVQPLTKKTTAQKNLHQTPERYYKFLEEQNEKLQQKVETLEKETRSLRDQKEQMLIEERLKIERIYKEKDEQLKNIINAISTKLMLHTPQEMIEGEIAQEEAQETVTQEERRLVSVNKYLKSRDFPKKERNRIKEKFERTAKDDARIITIGKKYYIDLQKYDYSDLIPNSAIVS
ncbi:MAG: DNA-binding protein [Sulfurimonas sp.]|uniref:DNA-binding protein n=1 Tax=Sulfurimonas sp. TaxID=2022749 RepID=UPI002630F338|nr:DNA-binding protein [Sulfurimonas sp.]MDD2652017.1 DNA-binding protein [Sulfurimonas sp.]MDD3451857.1 DNA-binding protein [Sulfurimonas sp.]